MKKNILLFGLFIFVATIGVGLCFISLFSEWLGLGLNENFFLLKYIGLERNWVFKHGVIICALSTCFFLEISYIKKKIDTTFSYLKYISELIYEKNKKTTAVSILNYILSSNILYPILLILTAILISHTLFTPFYFQCDDDAYLRLIAKGAVINDNFASSEYMLYINVIYGNLLVWLNTTFQNIPWYDVLFLIIQSVSFFVILRCMLKANKDTFLRYFLVPIFFISIMIFFFTHIQFSLVAMIFSGSSSILLFYHFFNPPNNYKQWILSSLYMMTALFIGSLIRYHSFLIITFFSGLLFIPIVISKNNKIPFFSINLKAYKIFLLIPFIFGILLSFYGEYYNQKSYQINEKEVIEYNVLKSELIDFYNPNLINEKQLKKQLKIVGWSFNDFQLFQNLGYIDIPLYSIEKVRIISDWLKQERLKNTSTSITKTMYNTVFKKFFMFSIFILFLLCLFYYNKKNLYYAIYITIIIFLLFFCTNLLLKDMPLRVSSGFIPVIISFIIIYTKKLNLKDATYKNNLITVILIITCIFNIHNYYESVNKEKRANEYIAKLNNLDIDKTYILWDSSFKYRIAVVPYKAPKIYKRMDKINISVYNRLLKKTNNTEDLFLSGCTKPNFLWIMNGTRSFKSKHKKNKMDILKTYMKEHYNKKVKIISISEKINLYQCKEVK